MFSSPPQFHQETFKVNLASGEMFVELDSEVHVYDKYRHEPHFVGHSCYPDVSLHVPGHHVPTKPKHQLQVLGLPEQGLHWHEQVLQVSGQFHVHGTIYLAHYPDELGHGAEVVFLNDQASLTGPRL